MEVQIEYKGDKIVLDLKREKSLSSNELFVRVMSAYYLNKADLSFMEIPDSLLEEVYHNFDIEELYLGAIK